MSRDSTNYFSMESALAERKIQNFWQHNGISVADYYKEFNMVVKITEKYGAEFATTIHKE